MHKIICITITYITMYNKIDKTQKLWYNNIKIKKVSLITILKEEGKTMGEVKQTNFRINTEDAEKFREFCNANGMNQAQGFDHIMQIIEMDKAKAANSGKGH